MNKDLEQQIKELQAKYDNMLRMKNEDIISKQKQIKELQEENKGLINNEYQLQYKESIRIDKENKNLKAVIDEIKELKHNFTQNGNEYLDMYNLNKILKKVK
jgi:hypothetical protein